MAKEKDSPCQQVNTSRTSKFAYTFCFISVLICAVVLVRFEIVDLRVCAVENSLAEIRSQNADKNSHGSGEGFQEEKREKYNSGLNLNDDVRVLVTGESDPKKLLIYNINIIINIIIIVTSI